MGSENYSKEPVVKFNGLNYKEWSYNLKWRLKKDKTWGIVSGTVRRPEGPPRIYESHDDEIYEGSPSNDYRLERFNQDIDDLISDDEGSTPAADDEKVSESGAGTRPHAPQKALSDAGAATVPGATDGGKPMAAWKWDERNDDALATIALSLQGKFHYHIEHTELSRRAWHILKRAYEHVETADLNFWEERFETARQKHGQNSVEFATYVINNASEINRIEPGSISTHKIARKILNSLLPEWTSLRQGIECMPRQQITHEYVIGRLRTENLRSGRTMRRERGLTTTVAEAHQVSAKPKSHKKWGGPKNEKFSGKCFHCDKVGHRKADCRKLKEDQAKESTNTAKVSHDDPETYTQGFTAQIHHTTPVYAPTAQHEWIVDSGASKHMTGDKTFLQDFAPVSGMYVELGDKSTIPAEGSGNLVFTMENGKPGMIKDVLYVPQLQKNLLSVSQASDEGLDTIFGRTNIKIKVNESTLVSGTRRNGLYTVTINPKKRTSANLARTGQDIGKQSPDTWHL